MIFYKTYLIIIDVNRIFPFLEDENDLWLIIFKLYNRCKLDNSSMFVQEYRELRDTSKQLEMKWPQIRSSLMILNYKISKHMKAFTVILMTWSRFTKEIWTSIRIVWIKQSFKVKLFTKGWRRMHIIFRRTKIILEKNYNFSKRRSKWWRIKSAIWVIDSSYLYYWQNY